MSGPTRSRPRGDAAAAGARATAIVVAATLTLAIGHAPATCAAPEESPASGRISVGRTVTVDAATVRLADVAVLEGNAGDFADVDLGPAPDPGGSRRLDGVAILRKLRAAGLDDTRTRYDIPATVRVARAYQDVGVEEIRAAVERDAGTLLGAGEELRRIDVGGGARIPPGPYLTRLVPPTSGTRGARRRLDVELVQDTAVVATVAARIDVITTGPVVVLRHPVARGTVLGRGDVTVEERELTGFSGAVLTSVGEAVGKEARAALAAGTPLTTAALSNPLLVRRGDVVTVVIETPGMRLSTPGEALEAGSAGAVIRVRNRKSQQELSAQVVERATVLVQY